jgi:hypothetical protein
MVVVVRYPEGGTHNPPRPQYHTEQRGDKTVEIKSKKENAGKVVFMLPVLWWLYELTLHLAPNITAEKRGEKTVETKEMKRTQDRSSICFQFYGGCHVP